MKLDFSLYFTSFYVNVMSLNLYRGVVVMYYDSLSHYNVIFVILQN